MRASSSRSAPAQAEASWSTGVDKTYPVLPSSTFIDFSIGPIPFKVTFEVPVTIQANAMAHAIAEAQFGVTSQYVPLCAPNKSNVG
jgi:hypothetical protein